MEKREERVLAYEVYLDEAERRMTVVQLHPDTDSLELHMEVAAPVFRKFADLVRLRAMDVYGEASPRALALLRAKSEMLGGIPLRMHRRRAGFFRGG